MLQSYLGRKESRKNLQTSVAIYILYKEATRVSFQRVIFKTIIVFSRCHICTKKFFYRMFFIYKIYVFI